MVTKLQPICEHRFASESESDVRAYRDPWSHHKLRHPHTVRKLNVEEHDMNCPFRNDEIRTTAFAGATATHIRYVIACAHISD